MLKGWKCWRNIGCYGTVVIFLVAGFSATVVQSNKNNYNIVEETTNLLNTPMRGDWIVTSTEQRSNETIILTGNLLIENGGSLTLTNVTLQINCINNGQYRIEVEQGGLFSIFDYDQDRSTMNDASKITSTNSLYHYRFLVDNGSTLMMKNSELHACGYNQWGTASNLGLYVNGGDISLDGNLISNNYIGVCIAESDHCEIINNTITENEYGLYLMNGEELIGTTTSFSDGTDEKTISFSYSGGYSTDACIALPGNAVITGIHLNVTGLQWLSIEHRDPPLLPKGERGTKSVGDVPDVVSHQGSGLSKKVMSVPIESDPIEHEEPIEVPVSTFYPHDVSLDIGDDGDHEWSYSGEFTTTETITGADLITEINLLSNAGSGSQSDSLIPLNVTTASIGKIQVSNVNITWVKPKYDIITNGIITNNVCGVYCMGTSHLLRSCLVVGSGSYDLFVGNNTQLTTLNTFFNKSKASFGNSVSQLTAEWFMELKPMYRNWTMMQNASTTVRDSTGAMVFTDVSDRNPILVRCVEYVQTSSGKTMNIPHNVTVVKDSYTAYASPLPLMDQPRTIPVAIPWLDLQATLIQFSTNTPLVGSAVTITATIKNDGIRNASGFYVRFYDNQSQIGSDQFVSSLAAGDSLQKSVVWNTPPTSGYHIINVSVDPTFLVDEDDESNNVPGTGIGVYETMSGDWTVSTVQTKNDSFIILNGNLLVTGTGNLAFTNGALLMNSTSDGQYKINVATGGMFSVMSSSIAAFNPSYHYKFEVYGTLKTDQVQISDMWGDTSVGGLQIYPTASYINKTVFSDNFDGGSISDWTVTTTGSGLFAISGTRYTSPPYSIHMNSPGTARTAYARSPSYPLNLSKDYNISFDFFIQSVGSLGFEVFKNYHTCLNVFNYGAWIYLSWGFTQHIIYSAPLTTGQWYNIRIIVHPSTNSYDIYVNNLWKAVGTIYPTPGLEQKFEIGDTSPSTNYEGEAYWDDFVLTQMIFNDDFNDNDLIGWTVQTAGSGIVATSSSPCKSPSYSMHMYSPGSSMAKATHTLAMNPAEEYEVSYYFYLPGLSNHWISMFTNQPQIITVIDNGGDFIWRDVDNYYIMTFTPGLWYYIKYLVHPSQQNYDIYVNDVYRATGRFCGGGGDSRTFFIGDFEEGTDNYGEAYWDDFVVSPVNNLTYTTNTTILSSTISNSETKDLTIPGNSYPAIAMTTYDHNKVVTTDTSDQDADSLYNQEELYIYGTNWTSADSDQDGWLDGPETVYWKGRGLNNEIAGANARNTDSDSDGMNDSEEMQYSSVLDPLVNDANLDSDSDGLKNIDELHLYKTDPRYATTSGYGWSDRQVKTFLDDVGAGNGEFNRNTPVSYALGLSEYSYMESFEVTEPPIVDPFSNLVFTAHVQQTMASSVLQITLVSYNTNPSSGDPEDSFTVVGLWDSTGISVPHHVTPQPGKVIVESDIPVATGDYSIHWTTDFDNDGSKMQVSTSTSTQRLMFVGVHNNYSLYTYGNTYYQNLNVHIHLYVTAPNVFFLRGHMQGYMDTAYWDSNPITVRGPGGNISYNNSEYCYFMGTLGSGSHEITLNFQTTTSPGVFQIGTSSQGWSWGTGDSDGDGLTDSEEMFTYGTKPWLKDTDGDRLTDYQEVKTYFTDPCGQTKYAVLILGSDDWDSNPTDDRNQYHGSASNPDMYTFDETAHVMYNLLKNKYGYTDDKIYYLSRFTSDPGVDLLYNKTNTNQTLSTLASLTDKDDKVFFMYMGHSRTDNKWLLNQDVNISWIDGRLDVTKCQDMIIVLDTCDAGRYLNNLEYEIIYMPHYFPYGGIIWIPMPFYYPNRVILTATDATHTSKCDWDDGDINPWDLGDEWAGGFEDAHWMTNWNLWWVWLSWQGAHSSQGQGYSGSGQGSGVDWNHLDAYKADWNGDYHISMNESFYYGRGYDCFYPNNWWYNATATQNNPEYPLIWSYSNDSTSWWITKDNAYLETITPKQDYSGPGHDG
ncbi:MAG: hypothetical protein NT038_10030 [Euryarchaeota archaeon]|nr:hypothetical protein [Euryarchaeota archaeon]